jgi:iron complex outermembrane receptor protein
MGMALFWLAASAAGGAQTPPAAAAPDDPETIVVTGERANRTLKDTPSSVAVFDKRELEQQAATDRLQQLLELVPNLLQPSNRDTPTIRGQSSAGELGGLPAFLGGARPRTVVQIDGRTITFNEFANGSEGLWDVDRVEVFRSPQTTTQGANSIAGAIFITTQDPSWQPEGRARAILGEFDRRQLSGVVSGPLIDDQLAVRVAGDLYRSHAADEMFGPVAGVDLNEDDYASARVKLLAQPHALPDLRVLMTFAHGDSQAPQGEGARPPFRERRDAPCICGYIKLNTNSVTTLASYQITGTLESRTTLSWGKIFQRRYAPVGFGLAKIHGRDRSLESVLQWQPGGAVSAIGGVAYRETKLDQIIDLTETPLGVGTFNDRQDSSGIFGEVTWKPLSRLSITGGARSQRDRQRRIGVLGTDPPLPLDYDRIFRALLPKVSAAFDVSDEVRVGVLVERAYNPGGVTLEPSHFAVVLFDAEYMWDYEAYVRGSLFGGALNVNANLFYNDSRNIQRTLFLLLPTPTGPVGLERVVNDPRAHTSGAEVELSYRLSPTLTLSASGGWLRSRIDETLVPDDPILGKPFAAAPKFTGVLAADWRVLPNLRVSSQIRHNSTYFSDDSASKEFEIDPSTDVDARASWDAGRFTIFAYAHNLFNEFHITFGGGDPNDPDNEVATNDPREIGVGLEAKF